MVVVALAHMRPRLPLLSPSGTHRYTLRLHKYPQLVQGHRYFPGAGAGMGPGIRGFTRADAYTHDPFSIMVPHCLMMQPYFVRNIRRDFLGTEMIVLTESTFLTVT